MVKDLREQPLGHRGMCVSVAGDERGKVAMDLLRIYLIIPMLSQQLPIEFFMPLSGLNPNFQH